LTLTHLTGMKKMDKTKLREIERKLNPKTNGFTLFKEALGPSVPGAEMRRGDTGLEAETNIMPPTEHEFDEEVVLTRMPSKNHDTVNGLGGNYDNIDPPTEHEFDEGLNLIKKRNFEVGDTVKIVNYENPHYKFLNGKTGRIIRKYIDGKISVFFKDLGREYVMPGPSVLLYTNSLDEGLNLIKSKSDKLKMGDLVIVKDIPEIESLAWLNGKTGTIGHNIINDSDIAQADYLYVVYFKDIYRGQQHMISTQYQIPVKYLEKIQKETDVNEGLNLPKKKPFIDGDAVIVTDVPARTAMEWLGGFIGTVDGQSFYNSAWKEDCIHVTFVGSVGTYQVPLKYLKHHNPQSEINEVSPYEESDWLQSEMYKQETKQITEWIITTSEPYDHFHWDSNDLLIMNEGKVVETIERSVLVENKIIPEERKLQENHKYDYGCLMTYVDVPMWDEITSLIDPDDLYTEEEGFGLETEPHATLLFGIHDNEVNLADVRKELTGIDEIPIKVKGLSHFENENTPYDVVKFDLESEHLINLNHKLQKFPNTNEFDYNPHMTIGYVKKGLGSKYGGKFPSLPTVLGKHIVYSHPSGKKDKWELPIESDVMNSSEDLMEGLNLPKKKVNINPICEIISIRFSNTDETLLASGNWTSRVLDAIESAEGDKRGFIVQYLNLSNDIRTTTLSDFKEKYFKLGTEYCYMADNFDIIPFIEAYKVRLIGKDDGQTFPADNTFFFDTLSLWLKTNDNIVFYCTGQNRLSGEIVLSLEDLLGPGVIIQIQNRFYTINDAGEIYFAEVDVG